MRGQQNIKKVELYLCLVHCLFMAVYRMNITGTFATIYVFFPICSNIWGEDAARRATLPSQIARHHISAEESSTSHHRENIKGRPMAGLCRHWGEAALHLRPIHNQALEEVECSDAMLQPLCTRQKPGINFTADGVGIGAGLWVRNMSLPPESHHLAHSDSLCRRKYSGHS